MYVYALFRKNDMVRNKRPGLLLENDSDARYRTDNLDLIYLTAYSRYFGPFHTYYNLTHCPNS